MSKYQSVFEVEEVDEGFIIKQSIPGNADRVVTRRSSDGVLKLLIAPAKLRQAIEHDTDLGVNKKTRITLTVEEIGENSGQE